MYFTCIFLFAVQTLVETNLFSDALSAASGPKRVTKRKRPLTTATNSSTTTTITTASNSITSSRATTLKAEVPAPSSPEVVNIVAPKFYQDTLEGEEGKSKEKTDDSEKEEGPKTDDKNVEEDDDIPLKKFKEEIELKEAEEKQMSPNNANAEHTENTSTNEQDVTMETVSNIVEKKPGPGCGPDGPPGVLVVHKRQGPKKKISWKPQESLEEIRYFELDETERINVSKSSFVDMKNMERFSERDAIIMSRRGFQQDDNMEPQTTWKPLIEVDDVQPHPDGNQSRERHIQAEREMTTLRALYFSHALIPDSPSEPELEPVNNSDTPVIPLEDITGNPDAVNDFTSMPWPESKGSPKYGDNNTAGTGGLVNPVDIFNNSLSQVTPTNGPNNKYNPFVNPFSNAINNQPPPQMSIHNSIPNQPGVWPQSNGSHNINTMPNNSPAILSNLFDMNGSPNLNMMPPNVGQNTPVINNVQAPTFLNQPFGNVSQTGLQPPYNVPQTNFNGSGGAMGANMNGPNNNMFKNGPPNNFVPLGPMGGVQGPMGGVQGPMGSVQGPMGGVQGPMGGVPGPIGINGGMMPSNHMIGVNNGGGGLPMMNGIGGMGGVNRGGLNRGMASANWRNQKVGPHNYNGQQDNGSNGVNSVNNWVRGSSVHVTNNGVLCKAFMRGHCRMGKSCNYIHPKNKRI